MKAILMSIKPQWVAKILNGEKTIEIRKKFPKDYVGWVYIYCTKDNKHECLEYADNPNPKKEGKWFVTSGYPYANSKVVARFWCDKVEEIEKSKYNLCYTSESLTEMNLLKHSCLSFRELHDYLQGKNGYAIHITNLEIFDEPKEISEFHKVGFEEETAYIKKYINGYYNRAERRKYKNDIEQKIDNEINVIKCDYQLTRAPQSWCYIEI